MNKNELQQFRAEIQEVIEDRRRLGEYDGNAKYMNWLLDQLAKIIDHALETYPRAPLKKRGIHK
jgi:hypothetical protein